MCLCIQIFRYTPPPGTVHTCTEFPDGSIYVTLHHVSSLVTSSPSLPPALKPPPPPPPPPHSPQTLASVSPTQHTDPPLSTAMPGTVSGVGALAVRPSPVSAAAVISSGPSGGLLLTSQAWDRVTSSLNMMGLNQQCVRLNRGGRDQTT